MKRCRRHSDIWVSCNSHFINTRNISSDACGIQSSLYWELDVFSGDNAGLYIAEIELPTADVEFDMPEWVRHELMPDDWRYAMYTNSALATVPMRMREYKDEMLCPGN